MEIKKLFEKIIYIIPNSFWLWLYRIPIVGILLKKRIDGVRITAFAQKTDFEKLNTTNYETCSIEIGDWNYVTVNVCFIEDVIQKCLVCLSYKRKPLINICDINGNNLWELLYLQPYKSDGIEISKYIDIDQKFYFKNMPNNKEIEQYSKLFRHFVKFNNSTKKYLDEEYESLIPQNKKIMGVLCRGTDYVGAKPKGHPVQPSVDEVISEVKEKMQEYNCVFLYLATDEYRTEKMFREIFGSKLLINKRQYYDEYRDICGDDKNGRIDNIHKKRENDNYLRSIEYISSLNLLAKCNAFIAGNCGGSRAVMYMNGGKFEYCNLFNLGLYN